MSPPKRWIRRVIACGVCILACWLSYSSAYAESTPVDQEREHYVRGLEAARREAWSDAVVHFRLSYELSGTSASLYNLAVALRALGRHRDARDAFDRLL